MPPRRMLVVGTGPREGPRSSPGHESRIASVRATRPSFPKPLRKAAIAKGAGLGRRGGLSTAFGEAALRTNFPPSPGVSACRSLILAMIARRIHRSESSTSGPGRRRTAEGRETGDRPRLARNRPAKPERFVASVTGTSGPGELSDLLAATAAGADRGTGAVRDHGKRDDPLGSPPRPWPRSPRLPHRCPRGRPRSRTLQPT